ncbi:MULTISPECIES: DUF3872 domain-containing protein [Dysgonomonas]|uniref:DUF3872 domain-containing protein n=1 Tax=Dysgonomonas TaxID=156973 RepID=UPI00092BF5CC|nr:MULTISPECIES: DUF3872 domain-containing protein [Dysgonomonas]MBN9300555.1 DUF3872 domain-containing protein [Dysgonomonas mossii]OJX56135.1 MAG: conjugal transfer protein [Dysgonomonas sp. 37-18]
MKKFASYIIFTLLLVAIGYACSDNIDIRQGYTFEVSHLPVQKRLKVGETAEIRCQLERSGKYDNAKYYLRYFQPNGKGSLQSDDGTIFLPNDTYELTKETFRLYYTSQSEDQQVIDIYFSDNYQNVFELSFSFNNDNSEEEVE